MPNHKTIKDVAKGRTDIFWLRTDQCEPAEELINGKKTKLNTREDFGNLHEFAQSLADGIKEPLFGYWESGKFQITNGERRWRGAKILAAQGKGIKILLPCMREPQKYSVRERNLDLLRTNNGKPLEMIEKAEAIQRLVADGMKIKEIAHKMGSSQTHVTDCIALLDPTIVAPELQAAVRKGKIKATLAVDLARAVPDPKKQAEALEKGEAKATEAAAKKPASRRSPAAAKVTAKHLDVDTGKKAQAAKKKQEAEQGKPAPQSNLDRQTSAASPLKELLDAITRSTCAETDRYDTLEFLIEFMEGRQAMTTATKFILGMI